MAVAGGSLQELLHRIHLTYVSPLGKVMVSARRMSSGLTSIRCAATARTASSSAAACGERPSGDSDGPRTSSRGDALGRTWREREREITRNFNTQ